MSTGTGPARKDRFTALDTLALVRELRSLGHARVDKASDLSLGGFSLTFRGRGTGRSDLAIVPGRFAALLREPPARLEELSPFARELRRLLTGAVLADLPDPAGERYLELGFRRADVPDPLTVGVELFGTGNVVVARGPKLVAVLHPKTWSKRTVRIGSDYLRPPSRDDPFAMGPPDVERVLSASRTDRVTTLSARLGLGGPLAEEVLARAALDPEPPATDDAPAAAARVHGALAGLVEAVGEVPRGFLYLQDSQPVDAEPYESARWTSEAGVVRQVLDRFSDAAWAYFSTLAPAVTEPVEAPPDPRAELDRLVRQQQEAIGRLEGEAEAVKSEAETILSHYSEAEAALASSSADAGADGRVAVEIAGRIARLYPHRPLRDSATALFEEAKRTQSKLAGARAALRETEQRREGVGALPPSVHRKARTELPTRPRFWFQRFRWFISSEGILVVGGRDAASNDLVVRRYLRPGDRYVHADLHGAPSVVVKHPDPPAPAYTDATLREAGQFGVAFSKAWRAGLASASAFWVEADQVSKAGASGEFVARGAWVVHGTKHVMKDLPTELGLGTVRYDGSELWCAGPPAALRARGDLRWLLGPGDERERAPAEAGLARELEVSRDLLQSLLPAGGLTARRA